MSAPSPHIPVMRDEIVAALAPAAGEIHVDGTFGAGGYTEAILRAADCTVVAIDRDPAARARAAVLRDQYGARFVFAAGCFGAADALCRAAGYGQADGFVLDIGVSSMQLDEAARGFSFRFDGPLDMRMDNESGPTAADIVNEYDEEDLADIIYRYGEERHSRRIARAIAARRAEVPVTRTLELAEIVRGVLPRGPRDAIDPATRTFQALRIAVNRELDELQDALVAAERLLREGGRLVVVSFHSLEDSIVKRFLRTRSGKDPGGSRHLPGASSSPDLPTFTLPVARAVLPTAAESAANPRSRSAKMRVAIRTGAPSWPAAPAPGPFRAAKKTGGRG